MKKSKMLLVAAVTMLVVLVVGGIGVYVVYAYMNEPKSGVEYFPYQESENGLWGMMSPSGEVLCSEEFKEKPTVVRDGRFMVRNLDGLWEIYTAEKKPKKVGGEYAFASMFQDGLALVAEKGKPVSIIDVNGKTIKVIDKIDGKAVDQVERFSEGFAVFKQENYYGVIDIDGDVAIKAEYCMIRPCSDGKFVAISKKYEQEIKKDSLSNLKYDILDTKGNVLLSLSNNKYKEVGQFFRDGLLDVYVSSKEEKCGGIINAKGDVVVKPTAKIKRVGEIRKKLFTYNNGDGWGLMNTGGESQIRAKYDELWFASDDILVAVTKKENGSTAYKFIDLNDNQIGDETYDFAYSFDALDGRHAFVKVSEKMFSIVDKKGVQIERLPDMVEVRLSEGDYVVESDYVDMNALLDKMNFMQGGIAGLTFKTTPAEFVKYYAKLDDCYYGTKEHPATDPYWYDANSEYSFTKTANNVIALVNVVYSGNLTRRTFITKRVIDYTWGDYYWYHNERKPTGYAFNSVKVKHFTLLFGQSGKMRGKLYDLYLALSKRFKNMGTVEKENNRAVVITLKNGLRAVVAMGEESTFVMWGDLKSVKDIDIDKYKDVKEKPLRVKDYDYFENYLPTLKPDEESVDSTAVE